jgi:hypothetical protein
VRTIFYNHEKCKEDSKPIDVYQLLNKKAADDFVLHGRNLVYVLTFSETVCFELHQLAQAKTGLPTSFPIDDNVVEGAKLVGNSDQMQENESAVYTANFGAAIRPQRSTQFSTSKRTIEVDAAIGCPRGGRVLTQDIAYGQHSLAGAVTELYKREVMALFNDGDLLPSDHWYGQHHCTMLEVRCFFR